MRSSEGGPRAREQVRLCPAWKCLVWAVGPSHPGTPTPLLSLPAREQAVRHIGQYIRVSVEDSGVGVSDVSGGISAGVDMGVGGWGGE